MTAEVGIRRRQCFGERRRRLLGCLVGLGSVFFLKTPRTSLSLQLTPPPPLLSLSDVIDHRLAALDRALLKAPVRSTSCPASATTLEVVLPRMALPLPALCIRFARCLAAAMRGLPQRHVQPQAVLRIRAAAALDQHVKDGLGGCPVLPRCGDFGSSAPHILAWRANDRLEPSSWPYIDVPLDRTYVSHCFPCLFPRLFFRVSRTSQDGRCVLRWPDYPRQAAAQEGLRRGRYLAVRLHIQAHVVDSGRRAFMLHGSIGSEKFFIADMPRRPCSLPLRLGVNCRMTITRWLPLLLSTSTALSPTLRRVLLPLGGLLLRHVCARVACCRCSMCDDVYLCACVGASF
ncbi:uncharacterized protein [Triticum aestivum]|uniref:uncharacterized protein n=1 Tax=Triticum aestivum TaxID=4565 RepID=UPI001D035520|nr:uncharacterized protein LOC123056829 [Triticum aestivum]